MEGVNIFNYEELCRRWVSVTDALAGELEEIAWLDGYPIYGAVLGSPQTKRKLAVGAGLHGDEPGGVLGLLEWLERQAGHSFPEIQLYAFPCLNPYGFENGQRMAGDGSDPNRQFDNPASPLVQGINSFLAGQRFALFMDLHEDIEFTSFYLWLLGADSLYPGQTLINAIGDLVKISDGENPDGLLTSQGIIPVTFQQVQERIRNRLQGRPLAHFAVEHFARYAVTTELPGTLSLEKRIAIQCRLLDQVVELC